jgi:hypothetical protein
MSNTSFTVPVVVGSAGRVNTPPATLQQNLLALVSAEVPGYTANLPGSLIEDISSTDVGALTICDQYVTETVNSLTPSGANAFLLIQLGQVYGVPQGVNTNTSVYVVFSGTVGFPIQAGFVVSDGTYQYVVKGGGIIGTDGQSQPLNCVATVSGAWAVAQNSVNQIVTSVSSGISLTCNNPNAGTPSPGAQTEAQYRSQVLQAGISPAAAFASTLRTNLMAIPGVQPGLISIQQQAPGWKILVGGGDPYAVGYAIFNSGLEISNLVGSVMTVSSITNANPGVVTTILSHGLTAGQSITVAGASPSAFNGTYTVTVISETSFSIGVNTTSSGTYVADSAYLTPNSRNVTVNINNAPDVYGITFVSPPQQTVTVQLTWNTSSPNSVSSSAVQQLAQPAIANYVNGITVGQPINQFELQSAFKKAVAPLIPSNLITKMLFTVSINGVSTPPETNTGIIAGDPESYFSCTSSNVTVTQG